MYISEKSALIPEKMFQAQKLSKQVMLPISIGHESFQQVEDIRIISIPEKDFFSFKDQVYSGFLQCIDYTNEYTFFSKNTICVLEHNGNKNTFLPRIAESHSVKYRIRLIKPGKYSFSIINGEEVYSPENNCFEVI